MDKLLDILKTGAPLVASVLGTPAAGAAVAMMASKLGCGDTVESVVDHLTKNPADVYKLRELDLKELELHNQNTDSARKMNSEIQTSSAASFLAKNTGYILDFIIVGSTIYMTYMLFVQGVPEDNKELALMAFGSLVTLCGTVVNFHRGSSKGSQDKNEMMKAIK